MNGRLRNEASDKMRCEFPAVTMESLTSGDLSGFDEGFVREDRRRLVGAPPANAEEYVAAMLEYFKMEGGPPLFSVDEVLAVRGHRLALVTIKIAFEDRWTSESLVLVQYNHPLDRVQRAIRFDLEDTEAAISELDEIYAALDST